jgi:hypothetical protein
MKAKSLKLQEVQMDERPEPAWWALYVGLGLFALVAVSKVVVATMPADMKAALDDPTTIYFKPVESYGKTCAEMAPIAKARGAHHWICGK